MCQLSDYVQAWWHPNISRLQSDAPCCSNVPATSGTRLEPPKQPQILQEWAQDLRWRHTDSSVSEGESSEGGSRELKSFFLVADFWKLRGQRSWVGRGSSRGRGRVPRVSVVRQRHVHRQLLQDAGRWAAAQRADSSTWQPRRAKRLRRLAPSRPPRNCWRGTAGCAASPPASAPRSSALQIRPGGLHAASMRRGRSACGAVSAVWPLPAAGLEGGNPKDIFLSCKRESAKM